jgi:DNA-binding CsgD family transcriptional regulator
LLSAAGEIAGDSGMTVIGAQATELERDFPFGVAIQLFEPCFVTADRAAREDLFAGSARRAEELLAGTWFDRGSASTTGAYPVIHSLFWLACNLASASRDARGERPLLMLVDDAHWSDPPSLRFLAYLAERIADLPIVLVVAIRDGHASADPSALAALRRASDSAALRPRALSRSGIAAVIQHHWPNVDEAFVSACARSSGGNPFLLVKLLEEVADRGHPPDAATASRLDELTPGSVLQSVLERLESTSAQARQVAHAIAVLGDGVSLPVVAELAGMDVESASRATDALAGEHLLTPGLPLAFRHPLIGSAVRASIAPAERGRAHCRAADLLRRQGAPPEQIAPHLLLAPPNGDPGAMRTLRAAASKALSSGAADIAVRLLKRALEERPAPEEYAELLADLGQAESAAGLPDAVERLEQAIEVTNEAPRRTELALAQAKALFDQARYEEAADALTAVVDEFDGSDPALRDEVDATFIATALFVPRLAEDAQRRGAKLLDRIGPAPSATQRRALAHMAHNASLRGRHRDTVVAIAERAWGDGHLLAVDSVEERPWQLLTTALLSVDEVERSLEIANTAVESARAEGSPTAYAAAGHCRAWPLYEQGRIDEAIADAEAALSVQPEVWTRASHYRTAYATLALCHLQRGEFEPAETALSIIELPDVRETIHIPYLLEARARLRLAQHLPGDALRDATEAGRAMDRFSFTSPGAVPWRTTAALAHLALGNGALARRLAAKELELARRCGLRRAEIRALRVLALTHRGEEAISLLSEAVELGHQLPPRLDLTEALLDLGAALRRANQRAAARGPLRAALELSERGGAKVLASRAQTELAASGARSRRVRRGGLEALTPSERRVGGLAARGLTTREMAEALFVTPKTVEFHLRNIYQKLDIGSRGELAARMGQLTET